MLVKVCNRCRAPIGQLPGQAAATLPAADPATRPGQVDGPFQVALAVTIVDQGVDLCPVCLLSAVVEVALAIMQNGVITPPIANALQARINQVLGFVVNGV